MKKTIIHLSDLHFRQNWEEDQDVVLAEFFKDLGKQIEQSDKSNVHIAFSGDVVLAGNAPDLYNSFFAKFDRELNQLGIPKSQRICVPGNHDISQNIVSSDLVNHEGVVSQMLPERDFNDYISQPGNLFTKKFANYIAFESRFAGMGASGDMVSGAGWTISKNIGVYCLNSALCSSGGVTRDGKKIVDERRLAIDTRRLQKWNLECQTGIKILVMHHPIEWLIEWAQVELKKILDNGFSLCLFGHSHDQDMLHSIFNNSALVKCSAPPLLTNKKGDLGYSMIIVDSDEGVIEIIYRQWTKYRSFVSGVNFSNTDDGTIKIKKTETEKVDPYHNKAIRDSVGHDLSNKLDDALRSFSTQPKIWVEPILNKVPETLSNTDPELKPEHHIALSDFILNPKSTIIKALPQFGLTCLAHYLCKEAWFSKESYWIYLDSHNLQTNLQTHAIQKAVQSESQILGCEIRDVKCIILDSWSNLKNKHLVLLKKLCDLYQDIPIIVMQTVYDAQLLSETDTDQFNRDFEILYLWALPRGSVRKIVADYNNERYIGDVDSVIAKITSDLEVLNLPRTPLNCLTLLKASEVDFDESPVNRAELINRILFILFNIDEIPTYKGRPDLKDCEYVLGYFCETLIREDNYSFTGQQFLERLQSFCKEKIIDFDVQVVFDILYRNNILIEHGDFLCFKFVYWIYYFAAQRMCHDENFANYILSDMRYASYPEIIEFYAGIDRRRENALNILTDDIQSMHAIVDEKLGLPKELNPYKFAQWNPSKESLEKVYIELSDGVKESRLPDSVKDRYADRTYDQVRPYHQEIQNILQEYSLTALMNVTTAGARALRNSDYADPVIKRKLLDSIMQAIEQISKVIIALAPILAVSGSVIYEGVNFSLIGSFGDSQKIRLNNILSSIPHNIISRFQNDLFSHKMGPLLIDRLINENTDLIKHSLVLLLIAQRPREWKTYVQSYIASVSKNSFYLMDVYRALQIQYSYSYASHQTLEDMKYLIKMIIAKHNYGIKEPGIKAIKKIPDKALPDRKTIE